MLNEKKLIEPSHRKKKHKMMCTPSEGLGPLQPKKQAKSLLEAYLYIGFAVHQLIFKDCN